MKNQIVLLLTLLCPNVAFGSILIQGNLIFNDQMPLDQKVTLTFSVDSYHYNAETNLMVVGAAKDMPDNEYAIAGSVGGTQFAALAPKIINLNGEPDQQNPICGKKIRLVKFGGRLSVVTEAEPNTLYVRSDLAADSKNAYYLSTTFTEPIQAIEGGSIEGKSSIFVATENEFVTVSLDTTAITNTQILKDREKLAKDALEKELAQRNFEPEEIDKRKKELEQTYFTRPTLKVTKTEPLHALFQSAVDPDTIQKITIPDMHWDKSLQRLFICRWIDTQEATWHSVIQYSWTQTGTDTPAERHQQDLSPSLDLSDGLISKVRTMHTSSRLSYLILLQGNELYSLPLFVAPQEEKKEVQTAQSSEQQAATETEVTKASIDQDDLQSSHNEHYFLADDAEIPITTFHPVFPYALKQRTFAAPLLRPMTRSGSKHLMVGSGPLPITNSNQITGIQVCGDAIMVSIGHERLSQQSSGVETDSYEEAKPEGIYSTQALFDAHGRIKGWTPWRHAVGCDKPIHGFAFSAKANRFWFLQHNEDEKFCVRMTQWTDADKESDHFAHYINQAFPRKDGGIESIISVSKDLMVVQGAGKIALLRTDLDLIKKCRSMQYGQGSYPKTRQSLFPFQQLTSLTFISGGDLAELGSISAAALLCGNRLALGGSGGLVIEQDGVFKKFGNYQHVKKIYHDTDFLYVLTLNTFDRIDLCTNQIMTLATPKSLKMPKYSFFTDCGVTLHKAILASSYGLFVMGHDADLRDAKAQDAGWTIVPLPEGSRMVRSLKFLSSTPDENEFMQNGMMYVMSGGEDEMTSIHRFSFDNGHMHLIQDAYVQNQASAFIQLTAPCADFETDGALFYLLRYKDETSGPLISSLGVRSGERFFTNFGTNDVLKLDAQKACGIKLARATNGNWFAYGDFGLLVHE